MRRAAAWPLGRARSPGHLLTGHVSMTVVTYGVGLLVNLLTGVLVARELGAGGRGDVVAATMAAQFLAWVFGVGSLQAISYRYAVEPAAGPNLFATWLWLAAGLSAVGLALGWLLAPVLVGAQSQATLVAARLFLPTLVLGLLDEVLSGLLLGAEDFRFYNLRRLIPPVALVVGLGVAAVAGVFTVAAVLVANAAGSLLSVGVAAVRAVRRTGVGRWDGGLCRSTLAYGARVYLLGLSQLVNSRLDLFLLPAILGAVDVGRYSIATNVAFIVATMGGALAQLALPAAARRQDDEAGVQATIRMTLLVSLGLAAAIAVVSLRGLELVYGPGFAPALTPLLIMLPGCVLYAGAAVVGAAISAQGRPFQAGLGQGVGIVVTVVGLIIALPQAGIDGAAVVSTLAYASAFAVSYVIYRLR